MGVGKNVAATLEGKGRIGLLELARMFLPPPPTRVWEWEFDEEDFDGEECEDCEDCDWEEEEW